MFGEGLYPVSQVRVDFEARHGELDSYLWFWPLGVGLVNLSGGRTLGFLVGFAG